MSYKYCVVPSCSNTTVKTPDKIFLPVPRIEKLRNLWCKVMRRDILSARSCKHCCEDHFNLQEDIENFWEFKLTGARPRLKKGAVPHIFAWHNKSFEPTVRVARPHVQKKRRLECIETTLTEVMPEAVASTSSFEPTTDANAENRHIPEERQTKFVDKGVQVNIKPHFRSKATTTKLITTKDTATSTNTVIVKNVATSPITVKLTMTKITKNTGKNIIT